MFDEGREIYDDEHDLMDHEAVGEAKNIYSQAEFYCEGCGWNALWLPDRDLIELHNPGDYLADLADYLEKLYTSA